MHFRKDIKYYKFLVLSIKINLQTVTLLRGDGCF